MATVTVKALVLARLNTNMPIVDPKTGQPLATFAQTINNAWANISAAFTALDQRESDQSALLAQIVALNGLITSTQGQVTAILAERQVGTLAAPVVFGVRVRGRI